MKHKQKLNWYDAWKGRQNDKTISDEERELFLSGLKAEQSLTSIDAYNTNFQRLENTNPWSSSEERIQFKKALMEICEIHLADKGIDFRAFISSREINLLIRRNLEEGRNRIKVPAILFLSALEVLNLVITRASKRLG